MAVIQEKFDISSSDEELIETFEAWKKESETYHDFLLRKQKVAEQYYEGNQTERDTTPEHRSNMVENRIFEAVETMVPVVTAAAHQFIALPGEDNELSVKRAENVQKVLTDKYETLEMQDKLEEISRHIMLYRFGVMKYWWSDQTDDVDVLVIDPRMIWIPKLRMDPHKLPYTIEAQEYTYNEVKEFFPTIKPEDLSDYATTDDGKKHDDAYRRLYRVYEVWTDEMVAWIGSKKILEKMSNPNWDFKGNDKTYYKRSLDGKPKKEKKKIFYNHLDRAEKPYVFFTTYKVGSSPIGSIALVEVGIPIQDGINVSKRRVIDNLRTMGNGQVYMDADVMSEEEKDNITDEPGLVIRGEGIASQNKMKREAGVPIPSGHFTNLQHTELIFDNIMGVHAATRGAAAAKTLGQDILSRQQDFSRIDLLTRILNRGVARIANGLVQLMKMHYTETYVTKILGPEGAIEFVRLNQDDIENGTRIKVKSGTQLPMDEQSLRTEAIQLWQLGGLDPVTLFERLKFPNPEKAAERLVAWKQGQLTAETQAKIQQIQAGTAAKAASEGGATASPAESGRAVETPANVIQRAKAAMGGTAPITATPNM